MNEEEIMKKLGDEYELKKIYYHLLYEYINCRISIKKYDDMFLNSNLNYVKLEEDRMDIYQYVLSDKLNYLYIRNNLYIFNLTEEEKERLYGFLGKDYNQEMDEFIKNTVEKVLSLNNNSKFLYFGPISHNYMAENGSLVVGMRYDEFNPGEMSDDEWDNNHELQVNDVYRKLLSLEQELNKKLDIACQVIQYNDFNTNQINNTKK